MKIGIDMRSIQETAVYRGIGKYIVSLTRALQKIDSENHYYLILYPKQAEFARSSLPHSEKWHFVFLPHVLLRQRKFIRTFLVGHDTLDADKFGVDVLFQLDALYPVKTKYTPVVSIVHDLIPFIFKKEYQEPVRLERKNHIGLIVYLKKKRLAKIFNSSVFRHKQASAIIAISNHTANDLHAIAGSNQTKTIVIPHGAETLPPETKPKRPLDLPANNPFIFYAGGVDPRKQLPLLIEQFAEVAPEHPELLLVIAGKEATNMEVPQSREIKSVIAKKSLGDRVVFTGYVSDEELLYLYKNAVAFVLPSKYEGFGMQILEAFLVGCPVVAYKNSSIPEVAGDAAILVEDGMSLMPAVEKILSDDKLRRRLVQLGKSRAKRFTWESTARQTLAVLLSTAKEYSP